MLGLEVFIGYVLCWLMLEGKFLCYFSPSVLIVSLLFLSLVTIFVFCSLIFVISLNIHYLFRD